MDNRGDLHLRHLGSEFNSGGFCVFNLTTDYSDYHATDAADPAYLR